MADAIRRAGALLLCLTLARPGGAFAATSVATSDNEIVHVLNRLAYGPRPGDVERVRAVGLEKWIEQQLHPEKSPDPGLAARLAPLETVSLTTPELLKGYEIPPQARREIQAKRAELGENASQADQRKARREFIAKYAPMMEGSPRQVLEELQEAKVLRAVYGERQLDEVLVDFWLNHFNVYAQKGPVRFLVSEYEREVIRPHAWGRFEDLLLATAESPAMLFYLDNWLSADPKAGARSAANGRQLRRGRFGFGAAGDTESMRQAPEGQGQARKRGLNENYAREIMELHTLGVDGGYTQKDVTEVARCFTGWTIRGLRGQDPEFAFDARIHDGGDKGVLGQRIKSAGEDEGRRVIHILATHPSTARFIATKLARKFVADEPPAPLVERAAQTFRKTDGDIRAVVTTIVSSAEFFAPAARAAKVKTPLEFVVSAVRASGAQVEDAGDLAQRIAAMGMPLYLQQPPTGYKDTAEAWVSTSGLLARLNFALDLAAGRVPGVSVDAAGLLPPRLVPGGLSDSTRKTLAREAGTDASPARVAGLVLGSPEFQEEMSMVPRRVFLKSSGLALVSFGVLPRFLVRAAGAADGARRKKTLVVVFQRGACDGLNTVVPFGESDYRRLRPTIAVPAPRGGGKDAALDLDGFFGFHPALEPLLPLWKEGSLGVVHAVGSPDATRSHFDAQDFMESGTPGRKSTEDGWMNRHLQATADAEATPFRAVAMTPTLPRSLAGRAPAVAMASIREFGLRPAAGPAAARTFEDMYAGAVRDTLRSTGQEAFAAIDFLKKTDPAQYRPAAGAQYPRGPYGESLKQIAQLLKADVGVELAFTEVGGWDHHAAEGGVQGQLANRLREFGAALAAFHRDLGDRMGDVVLVTLTEFGRTARENGNRGTDHGHASVSFVMGGTVRGGRVHGRWPGLEPGKLYEGRDLALTTDFRDLLAELLARHLGALDLATVFPGHSTGPSRFPGVMRG